MHVSGKLIPLLLILTLTVQAQSVTETVTVDRQAVPRIQSVQLLPSYLESEPGLHPAAVPIAQQDLVLQFDDLQEDMENYYVRIVHCNRDWTPSRLRDMEFLSEYNEFTINEYAFSSNTHVPYVHYRFVVPKVRVPGNYELIVYRDGNRNHVAFRQRFVVFTDEVAIGRTVRPGQGTLRRDLQEVCFNIRYDPSAIPDAAQSVYVVIRQNNRWDNAIQGPRESRHDPNRGAMEFNCFDGRTTFAGGSEYRFVDFTSLNFPGMNTAWLDRSKRPMHLTVARDKTRASEVYAQNRDLNGACVLDNRDTGEPQTTGQYLWVHFELESAGLNSGASQPSLFVGGNWSAYTASDSHKLSRNGPILEAVVLMKQGFYDYQYFAIPQKADALNPVEGDHMETENMYEILVYQRSFFNNTDRLVGYDRWRMNGR